MQTITFLLTRWKIALDRHAKYHCENRHMVYIGIALQQGRFVRVVFVHYNTGMILEKRALLALLAIFHSRKEAAI